MRSATRGDVAPAGVDEERADRVAAGAGGDVAGVGDEEAVPGRGGELLDDPDVVERHGGQLVGSRRPGAAG